MVKRRDSRPTRKRTDEMVGATLVAAHAGEMISETDAGNHQQAADEGSG